MKAMKKNFSQNMKGEYKMIIKLTIIKDENEKLYDKNQEPYIERFNINHIISYTELTEERFVDTTKAQELIKSGFMSIITKAQELMKSGFMSIITDRNNNRIFAKETPDEIDKKVFSSTSCRVT